ncbi:hypothetical protein HG462_000980 [Candidatus Saccharibacteria bacterium]|nr:hypothetical protein [Candidatus Saccharibacteria bacterium]
MKKIVMGLMLFVGCFGFLFSLVFSNHVYADSSRENFYGVCDDIEDEDVKKIAGCDEPTGKNKDVVGIVQSAVNVVISLVGMLAVFSIIYGGFTYITAQSDPAKIKRGKDMVVYAVVALVVAFLAYGIVIFVTKNLK